MLDLDSLRIFVTAAETENFTRTAQRLHMSQPSVSQHIQNLEQQLGIELFERHGRCVANRERGRRVAVAAGAGSVACGRQVEDGRPGAER